MGELLKSYKIDYTRSWGWGVSGPSWWIRVKKYQASHVWNYCVLNLTFIFFLALITFIAATICISAIKHFMDFNQNRLVLNTFFIPQFNYLLAASLGVS